MQERSDRPTYTEPCAHDRNIERPVKRETKREHNRRADQIVKETANFEIERIHNRRSDIFDGERNEKPSGAGKEHTGGSVVVNERSYSFAENEEGGNEKRRNYYRKSDSRFDL